MMMIHSAKNIVNYDLESGFDFMQQDIKIKKIQ